MSVTIGYIKTALRKEVDKVLTLSKDFKVLDSGFKIIDNHVINTYCELTVEFTILVKVLNMIHSLNHSLLIPNQVYQDDSLEFVIQEFIISIFKPFYKKKSDI